MNNSIVRATLGLESCFDTNCVLYDDRNNENKKTTRIGIILISSEGPITCD